MIYPTTDIVSIIGPTAVGKTKLGVYLGKVFRSEVISIDSLQCYKNGSIVTAKVTPCEADGVVHHLVDYLEAHEEPQAFVQQALDCVKEIQSRGKVPILVGGSTSLTIPILQACIEDGKNLSVIMLNSPMPILQGRIERRVDKMIEEGLLEELGELRTLEEKYLEAGPDFSRGVWKTIGYPEFYPCLTPSGVDSKLLSENLEKSVAAMKLNSVLYAKMQLEWSRGTLCPLMEKLEVPYTELRVGEPANLESLFAEATLACVPILMKQHKEIYNVTASRVSGWNGLLYPTYRALADTMWRFLVSLPVIRLVCVPQK